MHYYCVINVDFYLFLPLDCEPLTKIGNIKKDPNRDVSGSVPNMLSLGCLWDSSLSHQRNKYLSIDSATNENFITGF